MTSLTLELYFESDADRELAEHEAADLRQLVRTLAPHVDLQVIVRKTDSIDRTPVEPGRIVPYHKPSVPGRQSLLITSESLDDKYGWGWPPSGVVSKKAMIEKAARGGDPTDIVIHEWIHTINGEMINGKVVPYADDAENMGFAGTPGPDGEDTWPEWYRFALGG